MYSAAAAPRLSQPKVRHFGATEKLDVAEELRYELVLLTAHGIAKCTSQSWLRASLANATTSSPGRSGVHNNGLRLGGRDIHRPSQSL